MSLLALVRHGESRWNLSNRFTGWVDVPLSENGVTEAIHCAKGLKKINFDVAFTSELQRAQSTLIIILSQQNRTGVFQHEGGKKYYRWTCDSNRCSIDDIPIHTSELLNERYYGTLQGMVKDEAVKKFGKENVLRWRRGYADRPPKGESLKDVVKRTSPYFKRHIEKALRQNKNVLVAGHGNALRAIMKQLNGFNVKEMPFLDLPKGKHVLYEFKEGTYTCLTPKAYTFTRPLR